MQRGFTVGGYRKDERGKSEVSIGSKRSKMWKNLSARDRPENIFRPPTTWKNSRNSMNCKEV